MKAIDLANGLQKLVDALRQHPDAEVSQPWINFGSYDTGKEQFKNLARILPKPLKKSRDYEDTDYPEVVLTHKSEGLDVRVAVKQSNTCRLIQPARPAVYECDPILSVEEDAELEREVA